VTAGKIAGEIARALGERIETLAAELLPGGHREGREWRTGSVAGEAGSSLGVCLAGDKRGVWCDFATGDRGDALDLVRAVLDLDMAEAMAWSRRWLGIDDGAAELPRRPAPNVKRPEANPGDPDRWRRPWQAARPIAGTLAETYLGARGLHFDDRAGRALRFAKRRARKHPTTDELDHHPAILALLRDVRTGEPAGVINIFLRSDGGDRLRDRKGKTVTGRSSGAAVMLSPFDEPTTGLVSCEGVETGIAVWQSGLRPVWACGGAGNLARFPVLGGIECLTVAADRDARGLGAAEDILTRWQEAGRKASIVTPPTDDWADDG
jgi:hypothetical protein